MAPPDRGFHHRTRGLRATGIVRSGRTRRGADQSAGLRHGHHQRSGAAGAAVPVGPAVAAAHPVRAPGAGVRLSTAIASYNGRINFGVSADYDTVRDLPEFLAGIEQTLDGLTKAVLASVKRRG